MNAPEKSIRQVRGRGEGKRDTESSSEVFDTIAQDGDREDDPGKSVEGWVIIATGIHEEVTEDDVRDKFGEYGTIKDLRLNLEAKSGNVKGYVFIEYESKEEAQDTIDNLDGSDLMGTPIYVDWAFKVGPKTIPVDRKRNRSASPRRR